MSPNTVARSLMLTAATCVVMLCAIAQAQDGRYSEYAFSFQPPQGWVEDKTVENDIRVQYLGPQRDDRTRPVLSLIIQDYAIDISDRAVDALVAELTKSLSPRGMEGSQVIEKRKMSISGLDALQVDLTYKQNNLPTRLRQVYVPVKEHNRTYVFTFVDTVERFDESAAAAASSINSFTTSAARPDSPGARPGAGDRPGTSTVLLVLAGLAALTLIIGAAYLLLRRRG